MKMTIEALGKMSHFAGTFHPQALKEVLRDMNLESLRGFDLDLSAILELFPPEKVIQAIGWEKIIQNLDTSDLVKLLTSTLSEQERELLIEQLRQPDGNEN